MCSYRVKEIPCMTSRADKRKDRPKVNDADCSQFDTYKGVYLELVF